MVKHRIKITSAVQKRSVNKSSNPAARLKNRSYSRQYRASLSSIDKDWLKKRKAVLDKWKTKIAETPRNVSKLKQDALTSLENKGNAAKHAITELKDETSKNIDKLKQNVKASIKRRGKQLARKSKDMGIKVLEKTDNLLKKVDSFKSGELGGAIFDLLDKVT